MKHTIRYSELSDAIMALSALCGDITRRGNMLVDNDDAALQTLMETLVPAALDDCRIAYNDHPQGWRIGPTSLSRAQILRYLAGKLLFTLSGEASRLTGNNSRFTDDASYLDPELSNPDTFPPSLTPSR